ncbi:MAG: DUF4252 domain-containing protein [Flavobacteriaceae bacterium]|nr:DUF4252 domain-containing protein [Flavobacteriaceae bacterium]
MKKIITIVTSFILVFLLTSCNNESLQKYLVKSQEKQGFITFDVPSSILQLRSDNVSQETKETLNSIKKINFVALPFKDNAKEIEAERVQLEKILKNDAYKSLIKMKDKGIKLSLYYSGQEDAIDEVVAFGFGKKHGVGVARILGDNMNPAKILKMLNEVKLDSDNVSLKQFNLLLSGK